MDIYTVLIMALALCIIGVIMYFIIYGIVSGIDIYLRNILTTYYGINDIASPES